MENNKYNYIETVPKSNLIAKQFSKKLFEYERLLNLTLWRGTWTTFLFEGHVTSQESEQLYVKQGPLMFTPEPLMLV
jgi:hypothetical protein